MSARGKYSPKRGLFGHHSSHYWYNVWVEKKMDAVNIKGLSKADAQKEIYKIRNDAMNIINDLKKGETVNSRFKKIIKDK